MRRLSDEVWINGLTARVVCPVHGEQGPAVEYQAGPASCGCEFIQLAGGVLRAIRQPETTAAAVPELQTGAQNAG